jgi:PEGA domain
MTRISRRILHSAFVLLLICLPLFAQRGGRGSGAHHFYHSAPVYGGGGWYGGYGYNMPSAPLPYYGLVNPYANENPCPTGCNPNSGYEWDNVGTLIVATNPPQAHITLDGTFAGTTDKLGPFQLPVGEHTLHIEAPGYEPSDVIVKFDRPGTQNLSVELKPLTASAKPTPQD